MPDGVVLLDADNTIMWGNGRLREWTGQEAVVGENFYEVLGSPEILGPDFCPLPDGAWRRGSRASRRSAVATTATTGSTRRRCSIAASAPQHLIVTVHDVTAEMLQQQKLAAIHQAGIELADLVPDDVSESRLQRARRRCSRKTSCTA